MEQRSFYTNRSSLEIFFKELFLKSSCQAFVVSAALLCFLFPFYIKISAEKLYSKIQPDIQPSVRVLIETHKLGYNGLHHSLANKMLEEHNLKSLKIVESKSGKFCFGPYSGICIKNIDLIFYYGSTWAEKSSFVECLINSILIDFQFATYIFATILAFMGIFGFIYSQIIKGVRTQISTPITTIWDDLNRDNSEHRNFNVKEIQDLAESIREYKHLSKIKISMLIAKESIHELKSPANFLFNQLLRLQNNTNQLFRNKIIDQTISDFEPKILNQSRAIQVLAQDNYRPTIKEVDLRKFLQFYSESEELLIKADSKLMKILFSNLYNNAKEACPNRAMIWTTVRFAKESVKITIGNQFKGYVDSTKVLKKGYTTKKTGSGVGLSLCRHIAELHLGKVEVNVVGNEFKVILTLPCLTTHNHFS